MSEVGGVGGVVVVAGEGGGKRVVGCWRGG